MRPHEATLAVVPFDAERRCLVETGDGERMVAILRLDAREWAAFLCAAPKMARALARRLTPFAAPCLCHLTAPDRCTNCEDRELLAKAGVIL